MSNDSMVTLMSLWANTSKTGIEYMRGTLPRDLKIKKGDQEYDTGKILIFANGYKKSDSDPDWIVYLGD